MVLRASSRARASWLLAVASAVAVLAAAPPALLHGQASKRLTIAAASDLQAVLPAIVRDFERSAAASVTVSFGSSGSFFAQIQNGAPFDVFLSADVDYPKQLAAAGVADLTTLQVYATGHLVLWTRRDTGIDLSRGLAGLTDAHVRHVAIANPKYAPYGRAAVAALRTAGVYDAVQPKLVMGENISQAAQLVESGNAEVGIALAFARARPDAHGRGHLRGDSRRRVPAHRAGGRRRQGIARARPSPEPSSPFFASARRRGTSNASASHCRADDRGSLESAHHGLAGALADRPAGGARVGHPARRQPAARALADVLAAALDVPGRSRSSRCRSCCRPRCSASTC